MTEGLAAEQVDRRPGKPWHRQRGYDLQYGTNPEQRTMDHRHLDSPGFTLAAIDDIIGRGSLRDWIELDVAAASDAGILERIRAVTMARTGDESSINHDFWRARALTGRNGSADR